MGKPGAGIRQVERVGSLRGLPSVWSAHSRCRTRLGKLAEPGPLPHPPAPEHPWQLGSRRPSSRVTCRHLAAAEKGRGALLESLQVGVCSDLISARLLNPVSPTLGVQACFYPEVKRAWQIGAFSNAGAQKHRCGLGSSAPSPASHVFSGRASGRKTTYAHARGRNPGSRRVRRRKNARKVCVIVPETRSSGEGFA